MHDQLRQLVAQAQQRLHRIVQDVDGLAADLASIESMLAASRASYKRVPAAPVSDPPTPIAIANGRRLTRDDVRTLDENACDLILDMTNSTLRYKEDPEQQSPLTTSRLSGIGPYRIKVLAFMIEHFGVPLCAGNVDDLLGDTTRAATPQAFTKTISILRTALGGGGNRNPYIQSVPAWESSRSNNARAYQLNPEWRYLLISHKKI